MSLDCKRCADMARALCYRAPLSGGARERLHQVLADRRQHLRHKLRLDVRHRGLPPTSLLHSLTSRQDTLQQAVVIGFLPLEGEEKAAGAHPTQVDPSILEVVLE